MDSFRIAAPPVDHGLKFRNVTVDTSIAASGATSAKVTTETGVTNPAYILTTGALGRPSFFDRTKVDVVPGSGNGALDTAVKALHELGDQHGVVGISLSENANLTGGIMFRGSGAYVSNTAEAKALGEPAIRAIDDAARAVLAALR